MRVIERWRERRAQRREDQKKGSLYALWLIVDLIWILVQLACLRGGKE